MKLYLLIPICVFLVFSCQSANAEQSIEQLKKSLIQINSQIERLTYEINLNTRELIENKRIQANRISQHTDEIKKLVDFKNDLENSILVIKSTKKEIKGLNDNYKKIISNQATLTEQLNSYKEKYNDLKSEISLSRSVVTWVTAIVSIIVILVGLFFSQRFLELYSNYKVICAQYPKDKRDELGLSK